MKVQLQDGGEEQRCGCKPRSKKRTHDAFCYRTAEDADGKMIDECVEVTGRKRFRAFNSLRNWVERAELRIGNLATSLQEKGHGDGTGRVLNLKSAMPPAPEDAPSYTAPASTQRGMEYAGYQPGFGASGGVQGSGCGASYGGHLWQDGGSTVVAWFAPDWHLATIGGQNPDGTFKVNWQSGEYSDLNAEDIRGQGTQVEAHWGEWLPATVICVNQDGTYKVMWESDHSFSDSYTGEQVRRA